MRFFGVSFCIVSPSVCLNDNYLGLCSWVVIFLERAAHSVYRMFFSLLCLLVTLAHRIGGKRELRRQSTNSAPFCRPPVWVRL